jgi:ABC-2 type transport system permease protein
MKRRSIAVDSFVFIAAVAVNVVLLNMIGTRVSARADLTRDGIFTLSQGTANILSQLEDTLTIRVYLTKELPAQFSALPRFLSDKLEEYKAAAKGKLQFRIVYPDDDEKARKEAQDHGVIKGEVQSMGSDQFQAKKAYMGLVLFYGAKKDVIPWIPEGHRSLEPVRELMEYSLSARIKKLLAEKSAKRKIGFLAGHDEPAIGQAMKRAPDLLRESDYEVTPVDTSGDKTIPADIDVLVVAGPRKKLTDREKWEIDQHLMRGKPVAFFLDPIAIQPQKGMMLGSPNDDGLKDLVAHYGVKLQTALVLDERNMPVPVPAHQRLGNLVLRSNVMKPYPPVILVNGLANHPMARGVAAKRFILPFAAPVELDKTALGDKEAIELMWSSPGSWKMDGSFYLLNPTQDFAPPWARDMEEAIAKAEQAGDQKSIDEAKAKIKKAREEKGPPKNEKGRRGFTLGYAVHGKFKSFFAGKPLPAGVKEGSATIPEAQQSTQIIVLGSSVWLQDNLFAPGNQLFMQNAVDWLLQDSDLIGIRARTSASPPLEYIEPGTKHLVRFGNVLGVPLVLIGFGIVRWLLRRRRKASVRA